MDKKECTTLCYLMKDDSYLMMHRISKKNDENHDKYIGVGGHIEPGETPEECIIREVKEETNLDLNSFQLRGLLTFVIDGKDELAWLYTSNDFSGVLGSCNEGTLEWIPKAQIKDLPLWEGDKIFFDLLDKTTDYFSLKLVYEKDKLISCTRFI